MSLSGRSTIEDPHFQLPRKATTRRWSKLQLLLGLVLFMSITVNFVAIHYFLMQKQSRRSSAVILPAPVTHVSSHHTWNKEQLRPKGPVYTTAAVVPYFPAASRVIPHMQRQPEDGGRAHLNEVELRRLHDEALNQREHHNQDRHQDKEIIGEKQYKGFPKPSTTSTKPLPKDYWISNVSDQARSIINQSVYLLREHDSPNKILDNEVSTYVEKRVFVVEHKCQGAEADPMDPNHPDCSVLRDSFGLECLNSGEELPAQNISDPYEKGYIVVPGLTDPSVVAAAIYDEFRRINDLLTPRFPLTSLEGYLENPHGHGPVDIANTNNNDQHDGFGPSLKKPITIDVVCTYVDGNEESFRRDLAFFKSNQPPAADPEPRAASIKISTGAVHALSSVWESFVRAVPAVGVLNLTFSHQTLSDGTDATPRFDNTHRAIIDSELESVKEELGRLDSDYPVAVNSTVLDALRADSGGDANRFRDYGEMKHALRGIFRHIITPMQRRVTQFAEENSKSDDNNNNKNKHDSEKVKFSNRFGKIYVVVSNKAQRPKWIREDDPTIVWVEHKELFPNTTRSLPNFNSRAIESVVHRIPGLSRHYLYLNNDFLISRPVSFFDFFRPLVVGSEVRFVPALMTGQAMKYKCKGRERYRDMCFPYNIGWSDEVFINNIWHLKNVFRRDTVPFTLGFVHMPHMFDKLYMTRMLTEPMLRKEVCATRGSRKRNAGNLLFVYPYSYYSLWTLYGRNMDSAYSALVAGSSTNWTSFSDTPEIFDTLGRQQQSLWEYLLRQTDMGSVGRTPGEILFTHIASSAQATREGISTFLPTEDLLVMGSSGAIVQREYNDTTPEMITVARSNNKFGSTDHWVFDVISAMADPVRNQESSIRYYFAMVRSNKLAKMHLADLRPRFGKVVSVALNDDLPAVKNVPHPYFNISTLLVNEFCTTMAEKRMRALIRTGRGEIEPINVKYLAARKLGSMFKDPVHFDALAASKRGIEGIIDWENGKLFQAPTPLPRWKRDGLSPPPNQPEDDTDAFVDTIYDRVMSMCKLGTAKLALAKVKQSRAVVPIDYEWLLAPPSDPKCRIYGVEPMLEGFALAAEGTPGGEFSKLIPLWEIAI